MKKTVNVAIGGCSFIIEEDAYRAISNYLDNFRAALSESSPKNEVMDELENRIADLLKAKLGARDVVTYVMVAQIISELGYPDGYTESQSRPEPDYGYQDRPVKKLFRDPDDKKIAGVCSGLALFLGIDVTIIRVIFLVALICGSAGFWIYLVIWIAAPLARTAVEKCELRGIPATAENIRRFTQSK